MIQRRWAMIVLAYALTLNAHASDATHDALYYCLQGSHLERYSCCVTSSNGKSWSGPGGGCGPNAAIAWDICYSLYGKPGPGNCTANTAQRTI